MDIKSNSEVGVKYLHTWEMQEHIMRKGYDKGYDNRIIDLINKKLAKGKSIATIADELECTEEEILELINKQEIN